jgi:hypothetical protein
MELSDASLDLQHHGKQHRINKHKTNAYATWSRPLYSYTDITERLLRCKYFVSKSHWNACKVNFAIVSGTVHTLTLEFGANSSTDDKRYYCAGGEQTIQLASLPLENFIDRPKGILYKGRQNA